MASRELTLFSQSQMVRSNGAAAIGLLAVSGAQQFGPSFAPIAKEMLFRMLWAILGRLYRFAKRVIAKRLNIMERCSSSIRERKSQIVERLKESQETGVLRAQCTGPLAWMQQPEQAAPAWAKRFIGMPHQRGLAAQFDPTT